ncbi:hypothetical protein SD37_22945 [Amycolatopsis orientalis]|uniref:Pentapeptide repeat-containing protein n=1 Tax=Amycolatopsis orientalis TaxID=31958 RepID=A0A193C1D2_AMYOR|nr:pentapeptide repeat-containing protein [Amycolatopsis orientalis]ANN18215.1 hypothetical protein SD37_22945 [Amycolatopsis orientalis]
MTSQPGAGKVLSNRVIAWTSVVLILVAAGLSWPLLAVYGLGLEAIRTVGTIVLGAGGAIGLLLAARRQQTAEQDLVEKRRDLEHKERVQRHAEAVAADTLAHQQHLSAQTETDAAERRITELYAKAVEQLGSDKAPVRLGGLYALERLAQNTPSQRYTVVNVLCAYLRMPFEVAADPEQDSPASSGIAQERQVRIAAQRILAQHLRPGAQPDTDRFWPDVDLDLTGATLIDFRFQRCRVRSARFTEATFTGDTDFGGTTFLDHAEFDHATFSSSARFSNATFVKDARFRDVSFQGPVRFRGTNFHGDARFTGTEFLDDAWLGGAIFHGDVWFTRATFEQDIRFPEAVFLRDVRFREATFKRAPQQRQKMFKGTWARTAARSSWPDGWVPSKAEGGPWPDSGDDWQSLIPVTRR